LTSQILTSFLLSLIIIFIGKKKLNTFNNLNLLPLLLLIYLVFSKIFLKDTILKILKFFNLGFSFDIFLVFSIISILYFIIFFEINLSITSQKKINIFYYLFLFFTIFLFYFYKFFDHNYSNEKTSFLSINLYYLIFLLIFALPTHNTKFLKKLDLISKFVFFFIFINLATQTNFLNDLGDFDNGRFMNEVSAIFLKNKLHVDFFNFSGIFGSYLFRLFSPSGINSLVYFRIFLRITLIIFTLLIGFLLLDKSNFRKTDFFFPFLISIVFLNSNLTLRSFSKIFTFLIILIVYLLLCNRFSYIALYLLSLFCVIYFIELPTLSIFIFFSILICLYKDFSIEKSFIFLIFSFFNLLIYLQIYNVKIQEILLIPLSLGSNVIPLTFRDMPSIGPFDSHILIYCLLIPLIIAKKDKKLKFLFMTGLSFTVYYSHNSDSGHLMFTTMLLISTLFYSFFTTDIKNISGSLFLVLLGILTFSPGLQILPNINLNLFDPSEYSSENNYDQGNINLSEFSNLNNLIIKQNINKKNLGLLAPNSHTAEFLFELKTPDILSWPEELVFDKKIYKKFCENFILNEYSVLLAKEIYFHYYVLEFEAKDVLATKYKYFNICGIEYKLTKNLKIDNKSWLLLESN